MVAVSESTPGPIASTRRRMWATSRRRSRALVATLGLVTPAVICILIIAVLPETVPGKPICRPCVLWAASGIRCADRGGGFFRSVRISLIQESAYQASGRFTDLFFWKGLLLAAVIWVLTNVVKPTKKLHPIVYIAASAVVGIVFSFAGV